MNKEQYNQASEEEREKSLESNECRIGNWVKTKDGSERTIVNGWELDEGEELYPVPLTEEWLIKAGFLKDEKRYEVSILNQTYFWKNGIKLKSIINGTRFRFDFGVDTLNGLNLDYVHQLQNLYFEIRREELIFNP